MFDKFFKNITEGVAGIVKDPVGSAIDTVTSPVLDVAEVATGLTEGELRLKAAARLGADAVAGMALSEVIEALLED